MPFCSILGCKNRPERKIENITFHRFPKKTELRNLWILHTGRKNWQPTENARICSKHFEPHCFRKTKHNIIYLCKDSIPTLLIPLLEESITINQPKPKEGNMDIEFSLVKDDESAAPTSLQLSETPRKQKLRQQLNRKTIVAENRKKKLAVLRSKSWRLKKKNAELSEIINQLKAHNFINEESAAVLYSIEPANKDF